MVEGIVETEIIRVTITSQIKITKITKEIQDPMESADIVEL
jgi:hypothetical protein